MKVSACVVTRGDQDLSRVIGSLPRSWEHVVWDNSVDGDLAVFGRYQAALERASHDVIYVQDDDCVLAPEGFKILTAAFRSHERLTRDAIVCNMPPQFRHDFYEAHALVGFGAMFERRLIVPAFARYHSMHYTESPGVFERVCDVIFTALNERILVDAPVENLPWASGPDRMWRQPSHVGERMTALRLALTAREAA